MKPMYSWLDLFSARKELPGVKFDFQALPAVASFLALYLAACLSPAIVVNDGYGVIRWSGVHVLQEGFLAIMSGQLGWFANFWIMLSLVSMCFGNWKGVRNFSAVAFLLGLQSLMIINQKFAQNEGAVGPPYHILGFDYGFYLWLGSFLVLFSLGAHRVAWTKLARHYGPATARS